jgi:EspG family
VIDEAGAVDDVVKEWLTVLARRDVALLIHLSTPGREELPTRALLARFAQWWVVLERSEDLVRITGAGTSNTESAANDVVNATINRLCGTLDPAPLQPVTVDIDKVMAGVNGQEMLREHLLRERLDGDQLQVLAIQSGVDAGQPGRKHFEESVVTIADTPEGRLIGEHYVADGKRWMIIAPGSSGSIAAAVNKMMRRLPANEEWHSYRKVV